MGCPPSCIEHSHLGFWSKRAFSSLWKVRILVALLNILDGIVAYCTHHKPVVSLRRWRSRSRLRTHFAEVREQTLFSVRYGNWLNEEGIKFHLFEKHSMNNER